MRENKKLYDRFFNPFEIINIRGPQAYKLKLLFYYKIYLVFYVLFFKPYRRRKGAEFKYYNLGPIKINKNEEYEV